MMSGSEAITLGLMAPAAQSDPAHRKGEDELGISFHHRSWRVYLYKVILDDKDLCTLIQIIDGSCQFQICRKRERERSLMTLFAPSADEESGRQLEQGIVMMTFFSFSLSGG